MDCPTFSGGFAGKRSDLRVAPIIKVTGLSPNFTSNIERI